MDSWLAVIPGLLLGIALSAGSGFRIFIPLLISNLAAKLEWINLADNFHWMASDQATIILVIACASELAGYYVPFVDNFLDSIAVPCSVIAGTILTSQLLELNDPVLQWGLGLVAGGGIAGTVQTGTAALRLGSSKFTAGLGNNILSTVENIISTVISLLALLLPVFMGIMVILMVYGIFKLAKKFKRVQPPQ